ncbi:proline-rich protein 12-like isoform X4 [Hemicordylus capensis]|uniref:proline-rich protein 12-like isoform X4 n=1 Tax=Hemicordylus capensis TaxID=884348 RepID=UPI002304C1B5|nr:proline-rich protein 12-like isoform X4 [Hemicordylus capensis]
MPRKAKKKKGGWPIRQPKRPAPPPSSSEEDDEEMVLIRGLINRMEVLKKAKAVPSDKGAGPSGVVVPTKVPCHTCGTARTQLVKSLSNRMEVPEKGGGPAGPVSPTEPVDPGMLMPGGPVPVLPSPGVPLPPLPVDPVPVLPSSVVPLPPLPVDQSALNSAVPLAPGEQVQGVSTRISTAPGAYACLSVASWQVLVEQQLLFGSWCVAIRWYFGPSSGPAPPSGALSWDLERGPWFIGWVCGVYCGASCSPPFRTI